MLYHSLIPMVLLCVLSIKEVCLPTSGWRATWGVAFWLVVMYCSFDCGVSRTGVKSLEKPGCASALLSSRDGCLDNPCTQGDSTGDFSSSSRKAAGSLSLTLTFSRWTFLARTGNLAEEFVYIWFSWFSSVTKLGSLGSSSDRLLPPFNIILSYKL